MFAACLAVVPGWMVFREAVGKVELARFPEEIELALVDSVFDPPAARVKRLGRLLAHFGTEDATGSAIIGSERVSNGQLRMAEFFEGG